MIDRSIASRWRGPLLLDAAIGTRLIARGLNLTRDDPALWNLTHPDAVAELHQRDVSAGSDAILTNTFGANRCWLARFDHANRVDAINRAAVLLARQAAGPDRLIFGSIGPTAATEPAAYRQQAEVLADAGADALVFETHRADQAEVALQQMCGLGPFPLLVSLVAWPDPIDLAVQRLANLGASAVGGNCQNGMGPALELAERLREVTDLPLIVKPSAGLPGAPPASPESFADAVPFLRRLGAVFVGGCCGTTEAHVAALRAAWYHFQA